VSLRDTLVRRAVEAHATSEFEQELFLDMLGIDEPRGRVGTVPRVFNQQAAPHRAEAALSDPAPPVPGVVLEEPAPKRERAPRVSRKPIPPCGTYRAHQRHVREGEPIDAACAQGQREYQAEYRKTQRMRRAKYRELVAQGVPPDEAHRRTKSLW